MKLKMLAAAAVASVCMAGSAIASTTYDFINAIDSGPLGESIWSEFKTDPYFAGPSYSLIGYRDGNTNGVLDDGELAYAYADKNRAGFGVCLGPNAGYDGSPTVVNQTYKGDGRNRCQEGSDDSIQSQFNEVLRIVANEVSVLEAVTVNANHDGGLQEGHKVSIAGVVYTLTASDIVSGAFTVILNITMNAGDFIEILSVDRPHLYLQSMTVSAVPLPASALLLLGGLGGIAAMRRRKTA